MISAHPLVVLGPTTNGLHTSFEAVGDVIELARRLRVLARDLVDEILAPKALGEIGDYVTLLEFRKGVLVLRDALSECVAFLLNTNVEIPRIPWPVVGALEIVDEEFLEVSPVLVAAPRQAGEPSPSRVGEVYGQVVDRYIVVATIGPVCHVEIVQADVWPSLTCVLVDAGD